MTEVPDSPDSDRVASDRLLDNISRRAVIGSSAFATTTGLAGCLSLDGSFGQSDDSKSDDSKSDDLSSMWETEIKIRQANHEDIDRSFDPIFEYDPLDVAVEDSDEVSITRIIAAPAASESGDRFAIRCRSSTVEQVATQVVSFWTDREQENTIEISLNDQSIEFQTFSTERIAISTGNRTLNGETDMSEVLLTRGTDVSTAENLAREFTRLYDTVDS